MAPATASSSLRHQWASAGRTSFMPRTARIFSILVIAWSARVAQSPGARMGSRILVRRTAVATRDVILDDGLELLGDVLALERHRALAIDEDRGDGRLPGAGKRDADVGMTALARPVDDAAHDGDLQRLHAGIAPSPCRHLLAQETLDAVGELLEVRAARAAAAGTGHHQRRERAQAHGLEELLCH